MATPDSVRLRPLPYPYQSMVAICSDLDETPDFQSYFELSRFLNSGEETSLGIGLGLEVGNTIYFDMAKSEFAYWNLVEKDRATIRALIRSGHIDCFHSFGDLAATREHATRALQELESHDCQLRVWIDHAVAPTNIGADIMEGSGDVPGADAYHADITQRHGVQYVWLGRVTSVTGQNVRRRLDGLLSLSDPVRTGRTYLVELLKGWIGRVPGSKYAMHTANRLLHDVTLRDGSSIKEFIRSEPYAGGLSVADRGDSIGKVITDKMLDRLEHKQGISIVSGIRNELHQKAHKSAAEHSVRFFFLFVQDADPALILPVGNFRSCAGERRGC